MRLRGFYRTSANKGEGVSGHDNNSEMNQSFVRKKREGEEWAWWPLWVESQSETEYGRGVFGGPLFAVALLEPSEREIRHLAMLRVQRRD